MGFSSGLVSFRRFQVVGNSPLTVSPEILAALEKNALRFTEFGVPEETEYGWSGGRHVFDGEFSFEHNVFADCIHFALRIDTNKVPAATKKAWLHILHEAMAKQNPSGFISKNQKRDARDSVRRQTEEGIKSGKFRKSRLVHVLWDLTSQTLYAAAAGATFEKLAEIFERTFGLELAPVSAGTRGREILAAQGRSRDYEDLKATRFVIGPEGEDQVPDYPWVAKGVEPKDFLGNEFLLWLWFFNDREAPGTLGYGITVFLDKGIDLQCAYGQTGKDQIRGDGAPRSPEAMDALRVGKLPRKFGMILDANRQQFSLTIGAESLAVAGVRLPDVEDADSPRVVFEERIGFIRDLRKAIDGLFENFISVRASSGWETVAGRIRRWIKRERPAESAREDAPVAAVERALEIAGVGED